MIYSQSALLPALVSSRLHTQLEFQAIGSWWICKDGTIEDRRIDHQNNGRPSSQSAQEGVIGQTKGILQKIPSTREDVFADNTISPRDKRLLMKFLRSAFAEPGFEAELPQDMPLSLTMTNEYALATSLHQPLLALSLSYHSAGCISTRSAVPRIRRHMRSIGAFGPGFGAVMPKYGGGAEIAQVACRASAVGGAVYVLGRGLKQIHDPEKLAGGEALEEGLVRLGLSDGEEIKARFVAGCAADIPIDVTDRPPTILESELLTVVHSISIVSSALEHLFPPTSESGAIPAGAIVVYEGDGHPSTSDVAILSEKGPIYMVVHSSESGECPFGQCKCELRSSLGCLCWPLLF